jgi:hypothetical protein
MPVDFKKQREQIKRFVATGSSDVLPQGWPGDILAACRNAKQAMRDALIAEVHRRADGFPTPKVPISDLAEFTRRKLEPMVNGLFPESERASVLNMLVDSIRFATPENIDELLMRISWPSTAWNIANLYLASIGAKPLSKKAKRIVGLSEGTTCYVSQEYFSQENLFADFVVHEAAHVFHNCKRNTIGLPRTRKREFLLNIEFRQRETFAYACEVYSRILELSDDRRERMRLAEQAEEDFDPPDGRVDIDTFRAAVTAAASAKNGWKKILQMCSSL